MGNGGGGGETNRGDEAEAGIARIKVVAVIVAAIIQAGEERAQEECLRDHIIGPIVPTWPPPERAVNKDRRKEQSSVGEWIVPISVDKNVAGRRPTVVSRRPYPARSIAEPKARPPHVASLRPDPASGCIDALRVRRG